MMHLSTLLIFLSAFILVIKADSTRTLTQEICYTKLGSKSLKSVPTSSAILTLSFNVAKTTSTFTPTSTVVPVAVTTTSTTTLTSTSVRSTQTTDTATATVTSTRTDVTTITATSTTTTVTTSTTAVVSTSTVPTPAGFVALTDEPSYQARRRKRDLSINNYHHRAKRSKIFNRKLNSNMVQYPQKVNCYGAEEKLVTRTVTSTASAKTITAAAKTSTSTSTLTTATTSISTEADATVTITASTSTSTLITSMESTTSTYTSTSISTSYSSTSTIYAACQTNNIVHKANGGQIISGYEIDNGYLVSVSTAQDPLSCCIACQTYGDGCNGYFFSGDSQACQLVEGHTCDDQSQKFFTGGSFAYTIGNGPCSQILDGNPNT